MANENIVYGVNLTADQMKKNLATIQRNQKGVRTWDQILGASSLGYQQQQSALTQEYGDAITEAYKTAMGNEAEIAGLGLSDEQRANQFGLSQADLENTYKTYIANYAENAQTLADAYSKNVTAIDEALTGEAKGFIDIFNSTFDYLENIYAGTSEVTDPDDENKKITKSLKDEYGFSDYVYSEEDANNKLGEAGKLKTRTELMNMFFDEEGKITTAGVEFLDKMLNINPEGYTNKEGQALRNFDAWLSETNPELRTFYAGIDPYNYNVAGDRAGTFKELFGLKGNDYQYAESDYRSIAKSKEELGLKELKLKNVDSILHTGYNSEANSTGLIKEAKSDISTQILNIKTTFKNVNPELLSKYNDDFAKIEKLLSELPDEVKQTRSRNYDTTSYNDFKSKYNKLISAVNLLKTRIYREYENIIALETLDKQQNIAPSDTYIEDRDKILTNIENAKTYNPVSDFIKTVFGNIQNTFANGLFKKNN